VLQQLGISPPYVLAVSHFYRYKNLVELVQGFALAAPRIDPRMTLVIAGAEHEAAYACAVRTAVAQARLQQRVRLVGSVRYDWMPALYSAAELFVFPSICESFPQIPIEAMASGAATITSNVPPMPEVVGIGAGQFDPSDPRDIARAILDFLATSAARDNRAELRERGLRWVERYSWARAGHELLEVFEGAAAGRP
jgi:glycosyltransferase involved in cell wall biosynthesis